MTHNRLSCPTCIFVLALAVLTTPVIAQPTEAPALFAAHGNGQRAPVADEASLQRRLITVDSTLLGGTVPRAELTADRVSLDLFDGLAITATREQSFPNRSGSVSWVGKVDGDPLGQVVMVTKKGVTVGSIRTGGRMFMLGYVGDGVHALDEYDESSPALQEQPPSQVTFSPEQIAAAAARDDAIPAANRDGDSSFDLMVVYTPAAATGAGGTTGIENLIDLGVTETNMSYASSGITFTVNLVHTEQIDYTESGSAGVDRDRLRINGDGFMDDVHALRDTHRADITHLIINSGGCGIAYIQNPVGPEFESFAFCVTWRVCVSPNYTFAHEMGHLQAARHDYFVDPTPNAPYSYNHGYTDPSNQWRTVMAYSNGCGGCQRQLFWSNPDNNHPVTGNAMGVPEGMPQAADNRKTLTNTILTVANFRQGVEEVFADGFETGDTVNWSITTGN